MKGFTIIELMIVIAICGILAAIIIPEYAKYQNKQQTQIMQAKPVDTMQPEVIESKVRSL